MLDRCEPNKDDVSYSAQHTLAQSSPTELREMENIRAQLCIPVAHLRAQLVIIRSAQEWSVTTLQLSGRLSLVSDTDRDTAFASPRGRVPPHPADTADLPFRVYPHTHP